MTYNQAGALVRLNLYNIPMNYFCQKDNRTLANNGVVSTFPFTLRPQIIICPFPLLHFPMIVLFLCVRTGI